MQSRRVCLHRNMRSPRPQSDKCYPRALLNPNCIPWDTFHAIFREQSKTGTRINLGLVCTIVPSQVPSQAPLGEMPTSCMEKSHKTESFHYNSFTNHSNPKILFCVSHAMLRLSGKVSGTTASTAVPQPKPVGPPMPSLVFLNNVIKLDGCEFK